MQKDFVGFSFDGIHSSELGILRVSEGDWYEETLHPEIEDLTVDIPGLDGNYYFGSNFKTRSISISIAFDSMTELQFRKLRRLFGVKKNCELVFDERPYKVYMAKIENPIELSYVCFDEPIYDEEVIEEGGIYDRETGVKRDLVRKVKRLDANGQPITQRIYKGEGSIDFICYYPFARQLFKTLDKYRTLDNGYTNLITTYNNIDEWAESSGLLTQEEFNQYNIDKLISYESENPSNFNFEIPVYNPGDLNTGFYLYLPFVNGMIIPKNGNYTEIYGDNNGLLLRPIYIRKADGETGILINTVNHLIEGVTFDPMVMNTNDRRRKPWITSGNLYNEYIAAGDFPYIKKSDWRLDNTQFKQAIYLNCGMEYQDGEEVRDKSGEVAIYYDYLYL